MHVVGTAGHVDHGKSTLIEALTGINPDRLPQEKERGMTIDLGFAWLTLPTGQEISIVDVPGHERFVRNMLAGVGAIDLALLVVAADEGVMPQTREHLAILDLLKIKRGLVAITKADLVDEEFLELATVETEEALRGTALEGAPLKAVSARTGQGLQDLLEEMGRILSSASPRQDLGRPRLPVDRSFTVAGFGAVVTGTLIDGSLSVGQEVELVPSGRRCRIRGLQTHRRKVETADPGRRLAVNLSGVSYDEIRRGETVTAPRWLKPTTMIDAKVRLISDAPRPMKHNARVTFHALASETAARARLLSARELLPGEEAWAQIHLAEPVPLVKGDFFVIRSTETTLGGGAVVDPFPRRHRPFAAAALESLAAMEKGSLEDLVLGAVNRWGPCDLTALSRRSNLTLSDVQTIVSKLAATGDALLLGGSKARANSVVYSAHGWEGLKNRVEAILNESHQQFPLRRGMPKEELRSRLGLTAGVFPQILARLAEEGAMVEEGSLARSQRHKTTLSPEQERQAQEYLTALESEPFSPPTDARITKELLAALVDDNRVVKVAESVVFSASAYRQMVEAITGHIRQNGSVTVAEARTLLNSSRKYVLPLLEWLDQQRITRRVGDQRTLRQSQ